MYLEETPSRDAEVVTPDMLWRLYDCNDMMTLCTQYESFRTQGWIVLLYSLPEKGALSSLDGEMLSEFPRLAGEKCVALLLSSETSNQVIVELTVHPQETDNLFTAFAAFLPSPDRNGIIDHLLSIANAQLSLLLSDGTLDCVIQTLQQMHNLLRSLAHWLDSSQSAVEPSLRSLVSSWLHDRFATLAQSSATAVAAIPSIAALAAAKRQVGRFSSTLGGRFVCV